MRETTQTTSAAVTRKSWARCAWHGRMSDTTRLVIQPDDAGSAFGVPGLFACASCRDVHGLVPLPDQP
jgi:hypothetical protein